MSFNLVKETKLFNLSTRGTACICKNGDYKSLCEFNIPNFIENDDMVEYTNFSINSAVIPVSFFTVNQNNCVLNVIENSIALSYSFPYGNYNATTFTTALTALMGARWSLSLNTTTSVFTLNNTTYAFSVLASSTISSVMGFSPTLTSSSNSIVMPRCCNFLPLPRITFRCAELANTSMISASPSADVIITIPNNAKPNGSIYYQNQAQAILLFKHHELTRFVVAITDDDGNLLNFNGISSFFTFQFDIYRRYVPKPPRFSEVVNFVNNRNFLTYSENENVVEDNI